MVEVLASMAVLVVLVLALTRMFVESADVTRRGTTMLMRNSTGSTALETLLLDAEGMIVNERLACYVRADASDIAGFGFDEVFFISTSGDQDDDMPYEYFHFYVTNRIATNNLGAPYVRFDLIKARMIFAVGDNPANANPFYALDPGDVEWWQKAQASGAYWDQMVMADNIVRFDIYCLGWDGSGWMGSEGVGWVFNSTQGYPDQTGSISNVPPAAFDIYLQITSPETAVESGMALVDGVAPDIQVKAREKMIQDSASLFGRAVPLVGAARYNTVTKYGVQNTKYYMD
jgi:hypothetical protein